MFLNKLRENNPALIDYAFKLHQSGEILPDTYLLDLDTIVENGKAMVKEAAKWNIQLYFMLKQIGRNPLVAKKLMEIGFQGCVAVDYKEALTMIDKGIHLAHVGHLEQIPKAALDRILGAQPDYVTVYSNAAIRAINETCEKLGLTQKVLIRLTDSDAHLYSGQIGGFDSSELPQILEDISKLNHVSFGGITIFPALLYSGEDEGIIPTENFEAVIRAKTILYDLNVSDYMVNLPSASCCDSLQLIHQLDGGSAEPGHGLTGTTPLHAHRNEPEKQAYCYVSEISHHFGNHSYCYGGGHYRRGHMANVLVGTSLKDSVMDSISAPDDDSIDYHFELKAMHPIHNTCIMAFRTQIFTTRSQVGVVEGLRSGQPHLAGLYTALGEPTERNW